jgi:4-amino-4-deoxy-L-arabinose transferase-like glycosyltransferase
MGNKPAQRIKEVLLLAGLALLMLLPAAALRPPARQQELRVLISGRNMVTSGDWLRPEFQNQPRYRKPPMPYWLAASAMLPDRLTDSEFRARIPFVFSAVGALLLLRILSGSLTAPLLLLTSFGFWRFAPLAETDMVNALGICLSMLGFQRKRAELTALGITFSILSKGPAGLVIPLLTFLCLIRTERRSPGWWAGAFLPPVLVGAAWTGFLLNDPVARTALSAEISDTFIASPNWRSPLFYVYTLPAMLGPAFFIAFPRKITKPKLSLPHVWFAVTFLLLTLTPSKQNHYVLMLLPPAVWLLGPFAPRKHLITAVSLVILAGIAGDLHRSRHHEEALHSDFLRSVRPMVRDAPNLWVNGINSARFDFHLGRHVHNVDDARLIFGHAGPGDAVIILQRRERIDIDIPPTPHSASDGTWIRMMMRRP